MASSGSGSGPMTNAPGAGGPVSTIPPASFRQTPSSSSSSHGHGSHYQQTFSPRPPGSLSPHRLATAGTAGASSLYTSPVLGQREGPHLSGHASPQLAAASGSSSQLNRSQSLGHAAYQQYHGPYQPQYQDSRSSSTYSAATAMSYQPARDRGAYQHQQEAGGRPYSSSRGGNSASLAGGGSSSILLPTINTQIPSGSFMNMPYSPASATTTRQASTDSPYQPRVSGGDAGTGGQRSPYAASSNGPYNLYEQGYKRGSVGSGSGAALDAQQAANSYMASASMQGQPSPHLQLQLQQQQLQQAGSSSAMGSTVLPMHYSSPSSGGQYNDSLPLYNAATSQPLSSPYMPTISPSRLGAPPRGPAASDRMSMEPGAPGSPEAQRRRERRGTITSADTTEHEAWRQHASQQPTEPPKRLEGFRRVRDPSDLKANLEPAQQGRGRRADPAGGYVSPLKAMTAYLHHTYHLVNPNFFYELSFNPRRVLTKPSKPMHNDGHDNEDSDYILYVNDYLGSEESNRYLILDILGQGTFGQVVKCQNMKTREIVAVKVIKNKPAYFNQSMMEVTILETLNRSWDPKDEHHILRLRDTFIHAKHLCLVFELLSSNLYELIKQNSFRGLSTSLVRVFTTQLLDALTVLNDARLIHCDLKPENILLKTLQTPSIKLVDFGSACHERQVVYSYIQSRFYRSPEVLLGLPYNSAIDMWSLGCIAVELFLGLPLFPGTSEYNQICRIVEMLGLPPQHMLDQGKQTAEFFNIMVDEYGRKTFKLKSLDQYSKEHGVKEQPSKRYFQATTLPDIVKTYPMSRKSGKPGDVQKEMTNRTSFIDFVSGLLNMDPLGRWTPQQAKQHPFVTGEKFTAPFKPPVSPVNTITRPETRPSGSSDASRHPYGGLPETARPSGSRTYQDAAAYSQHLAQQQIYNSTAQARQQQSNNPYANDVHSQAQPFAQQTAQSPYSTSMAAPSAPSSATTSYSNQNRGRSNTMTRMDTVPPQLASLGLDSTHFSSGQVPAGSTGSPAFDTSGAYRQQQANASLASGRMAQAGGHNGGEYAQLDTMQSNVMSPTSPQSANTLSPTGPPQNWSQSTLNRMAAQQASRTYSQPQQAGMAGSPHSFSVVVDGQQQQQQQQQQQRAAVGMARTGSGASAVAQVPAPPPAAYPSGAGRYPMGMSGGSSAANAGLSFDPYGSDAAQLMPAMQPTQYPQQGGNLRASASQQYLGGQRQPSLPAVGSHGSNSSHSHASRHSIAAPPATHVAAGASSSSAAASNASLNSLRSMYSPNANMSGIVPGMLLPAQSAPSASGQGITGTAGGSNNSHGHGPGSAASHRSDGYGGLSDIMFSPSSGGNSGGLPQYHQQR